MGSGSTQHAIHASNHLMRLQWLALYCAWVLARCPACGANGHGGLTADRTVTLLLLAEALQIEIAPAVPQIPGPHTTPPFIAPTEAAVHVVQFTALEMGHLVWVRVSDFSKNDPPTHSQPRQQMPMWYQCADTCEQLGGRVPAMQ